MTLDGVGVSIPCQWKQKPSLEESMKVVMKKKEELYVTDDEARAIIGNRKIVAFDPEKSDIIYGVMKKKERFISCKSKA